MSTFLGFEDFIIPLGDSVQDVQNTFETALNSYGWQTQSIGNTKNQVHKMQMMVLIIFMELRKLLVLG